jgi:hypothetical protein
MGLSRQTGLRGVGDNHVTTGTGLSSIRYLTLFWRSKPYVPVASRCRCQMLISARSVRGIKATRVPNSCTDTAKQVMYRTGAFPLWIMQETYYLSGRDQTSPEGTLRAELNHGNTRVVLPCTVTSRTDRGSIHGDEGGVRTTKTLRLNYTFIKFNDKHYIHYCSSTLNQAVLLLMLRPFGAHSMYLPN